MSSEAVRTAPPDTAAAPETAITAEGLGKCYLLYDRPQDRLKDQLFWRFGRRFGHEFWALRDVSFEVHRGEAMGIVGRNGSGKSTLLQILAGTLQPTVGAASVHGRVGALLELGSGFNPEFSGRENVFMNGAVLGIGEADMARRFDAIAAFADIGEFMEQPVKLYSSGMVIRLAFAVQAHVDADVLIIDEALSVGDLYFQHRCMRRIRQLLDRGTTLLFVSHATDTVKRFCRRGLWLDGGEARYFGEAGVAVERYLAATRMRETNAEPSDDDVEAPVDTAELAPMLAQVAGEIDVADDGLFLRGAWSAGTVAEGLLARSTADPGAVAGFRGRGTRVDLAFLTGPGSGSVTVTIDGRTHRVEPSAAAPARLDTFSFLLDDAVHTVLLSPAAPRGGPATAIRWAGGRLTAAPPLPFRRDPSLGSHDDAVERYGSGRARLTAVEVLDHATGGPTTTLALGQYVRLRLHAERFGAIGPRADFSFIVRDKNRVDIFGTTTIDEHVRLDVDARFFVVDFVFQIRLAPGSYSILAAFVECSDDLSKRVPLDQVDIARVITVDTDPRRPVWYVYHEPIVTTAATYAEEAIDA